MIDSYPISFPKLGLYMDFKNYFTVFGFPIYWYAVIICVGLVAAYIYADRRAPEFHVKRSDLLDGLLIGVPVAIVGARLFYVLFAPAGEIQSFADIFNIRNGGLSIIGAILMVAVFALIFCHFKKIKVGNVLDLVSLGFLLGQAIGRWGNFINREVYGVETALPWGMSLDGGTPRHPLFLYECLWNLLGFFILHIVSKRRKFPGQITLLYMGWYGVGRGLLEGLRDPAYILTWGTVPISQIVSWTLVAVALLIYVVKYIEANKIGASFEYGVNPGQTPVAEGADGEQADRKLSYFARKKQEKAEARRREYKPMYDIEGLAEVEEGQQDAAEAGGEDTQAGDAVQTAADSPEVHLEDAEQAAPVPDMEEQAQPENAAEKTETEDKE